MTNIAPALKPFAINQSDIQFILDQLNFKPLFDAAGHVIINWDGTGTVYNNKGVAYTNLGNPAANIAAYGTSYQSTTDLAGLRDVTGLNNNLSLVNSTYGAVDQIFTRSAAADYAGYSPLVQAVADYAYAAAKGYYSSYSLKPLFADALHTAQIHDWDGTGTVYLGDGTAVSGGINAGDAAAIAALAANGNGNGFNGPQDYAITLDGSQHATDGTAITIKNVVDYTPRMISLTTTTAGVVYDTWANHVAENVLLPLNEQHTTNEIYYTNGVATVLDWGQLATVADGGQGQVDPQGRLLASAGQDDHFIGGLNPGVSPSNGFFVLFGQFFDHGLDFIGKSSGAKIKIALATDDPLYGMAGPDGQPVHEITITRATVQTMDAKGPEYVNHTSPFIDQSQTYGSHEQLTTLLREWVKDPVTGDYHAGMKLFDGSTLADGWKQADGTIVHDTLPTLNELRDQVLDTNRAKLTWDDVLDLRNRDASTGALTSGNSGSALLLDMNPRFDAAHLTSTTDIHGTTVASLVTSAAGVLGANLASTISSMPGFALLNPGRVGGDTFTQAGDGTIHMTLASDLVVATGPTTTMTIAAGDYSGANALMLFVNFADFSINPNSPTVHDAVSDILMAAVGDHYIAGDGRVNENFGLTSIHHIFHEEHNYQVQNLIDALHAQDVANPDGHAKLHDFQKATAQLNETHDYVVVAPANIHAVQAVGDVKIFDASNTLLGYAAADKVTVNWDMDKVFNGAKLIVEMEYQHAAVDQYARNVTPNIQEFVGYSPDKDPSVTLEYAQAAFRFGHSTLRETIDTIDPTHGLTGKIMGYALKEAFLSPEQYAANGPASILLGMSHQQMNEVDEFVTPALNQGLLGQPLDLAAINIARGRDIGIPTLNDFREAIGLVKYTSWTDFGQNMQHASSLVNFIAAYSFDGDMAKAQAVLDLIDGVGVVADNAALLGWSEATAVADAFAFLEGGDKGFEHIDTWLGGLAEIHQPGGLLGETFDKVFVNQIESLMDGDRFYYLFRLAGQQFAEEVGGGQLKDIVERNTGLEHLNGNIFGYSDKYYDFGAHKEISTDGTELQTTENNHKYGDVYNTTHNPDGSVNFEATKVADGALTTHPSLGIYSNGGRSSALDGTVVHINGADYIRDTRLENGVQTSVAVANASFEANSLATGSAGVVEDAVRGNYTVGTNPDTWTIAGGLGGLFKPTAVAVSAAGHTGGNVVWLQDGAILSKVTGALEEGHTYTVGFNVGDRVDQAGWTGGTARLIATNGTSSVELSTIALSTLGEGKWNHITFDTGNIDATLAGYSLRIEIEQGGGSNQVLVDNVELTSAWTVYNDGVNLDDTPNSGAESNEVMVGTAFNDLIYAQGGDDTVYGEGGNDTIFGGYGIDRLYGGAGADTLWGGDNPDLMDGGSGDDALYGDSSGSDINGADQLIGGSGNDYVDGGIGIDKLSGGTGDDHVVGGQDTDPFTHGSDGNDIVEGNSGGDILYGDNGDDLVIGGADQDQIFGNSGDDILRPGDPTGALTIGTDEVLGNDGVDVDDKGFDLIDFSDNTQVQLNGPGVAFDIGAQVNPAVTVNGTPTQVQSFQVDGAVGSIGNDTLTGSDQEFAAGGINGVRTAIGGSGADASIAGHNWLVGGSGNDTLTGGGGNDIIIGGSVRLDTLVGKYTDTGGDGHVYDNNNDNNGLTIEDQKQDALYQGASHRALYTDAVTGGLLDGANTGMFDKHFTEMLRSEQFQDAMLGDSAGLNTAGLTNGGGNDTAVFTGNRSDYTVVMLDAAGVITTDVNLAMAVRITDNRVADIDGFLIDGSGVQLANAAGDPMFNEGTDLLIGIDNFKFADVTRSLAQLSNMTPTGDLLLRGSGSTIMVDMTAIVDTTPFTNVMYQWQQSTDGGVTFANFGGQVAGSTTVLATGALTLAANDLNFYRVVVTYTDGSNVNEIITSQMQARVGTAGNDGTATGLAGFDGNDNPNLLNGLGGNDFLYGLGGNDAINGGGGNDTISGGDGNDRIYGGIGNDTINGDAGNDTIIVQFNDVGSDDVTGGDDLDTLQLWGGATNDTFTVDYTGGAWVDMSGLSAPAQDVEAFTLDMMGNTAAGDTLNYGGNNTIAASADNITVNLLTGMATGFTDVNGVEVAGQITGVENVNGGDGNDSLTGDGNANVFDGGAGNDRLIGGLGIDIAAFGGTVGQATYGLVTVGQNAGSITVNAGADGTDTISGIETLRFGNGFGALSYNLVQGTNAADTVLALTGTAGNDLILGFNGSDTLTGGLGRDYLDGGAGDDTLIAGIDNVRDILNGGAGTGDTADYSSSTANLSVTLNGATLATVTGTGSNAANSDQVQNIENFIGGSGADTITGNAAANVLNGGGGNDTVAGGAGNDTINYSVTTTGLAVTSGRDFIDGGTTALSAGRDTGSDTFVLNGSAAVETFKIMTAFEAGQHGLTGLNANTEIVIVRQDGTVANNVFTNMVVLAELDNIEEIRVNTFGATLTNPNHNSGTGGGDTIQILGDYGTVASPTTSLNFSTITINGGADDTVDISGLTSDHRIVFNGATSPNQIIGDLRPQDVVNYGASGNDDQGNGGSGGGNDTPPLPADLTLMGDGTSNLLQGAGGNDTALGLGAEDMITTGAGDDYIDGGAGNDTIMAGSGNDIVMGGEGADVIFGNDGNDMITGGIGDDTVFGGSGDDTFVTTANDGSDSYHGDAGNDTVDMSAVMANISANLGSGLAGWATAGGVTDQLYSIENIITGAGNDTITASGVANIIDTGTHTGAGHDTVVFHAASDANGDTILNFEAGDKIDVSGFMGGTFTIVPNSTMAGSGEIAYSFANVAGEEFTVVHGHDANDNEFHLNIKGHHNLTGTDFAA